MKNVPSSSIAKFIPIVLLILVLPVVYKYSTQEKNEETKQQQNNFYGEISELVTKVKAEWEDGLIQGLSKEQIKLCTDIPVDYEDLPMEFFKCNPGYLNCALSRTKIHKSFRYLGLRRNLMQKGRLIVDFETVKDRKKVSLQLDSYCHEAYLPKKIYSAGPTQNKELIWDNRGRDYFIDIFPVNHYEKKFWETGITKIEMGDEKPLLNLSLKEMRKTCSLMGKKLLTSRLFDAATFYPSNIENHGYIYKSKFPWSKKSNDITKERLAENVSWIGLYGALGGFPEIFSNSYNSRANIKLSKGDMDIESPWHQLGLRAYWDGEGLEDENFEFVEQYSNRSLPADTPKGVAFRCSHLE